MNTLRNDRGTMIGKLTPRVVNALVNRVEGIWSVLKYPDKSVNCFIFKTHAVMEFDGQTFYIWKGYYIEGNIV